MSKVNPAIASIDAAAKELNESTSAAEAGGAEGGATPPASDITIDSDGKVDKPAAAPEGGSASGAEKSDEELAAELAARDGEASPSGEAESGEEGERETNPKPESDSSDASLVEVDGKKYFYHPKHHAKGEKTHPNAYETRDNAEVAAIAKVEHMRNLANQLKEKRKGVVTLGLPGVVGRDIAKLEALGEEDVIAMADGDLQTFLKESDQFMLRAEDKIKRTEEETKKTEETQAKTQKVKDLEPKAASAIKAFNIDVNAAKTVEDVIAQAEKGVNAAVTAALAEDIKALEAFEADEDQQDELGANFGKEVRKRTEALIKKRSELENKFKGQVTDLKEYLDATMTDNEEPELSAAEQVKLRKGSFDEFIADNKGRSKLADNKDMQVAFYNWASKRKGDFNKLLTADDFVSASEAYMKNIEELRAKHRAEVLNKDKPKKDEGDGKRPPIAPPNPNSEVNRNAKSADTQQRMKQKMKELAEWTNNI